MGSRIVIVAGPTASGKSARAIDIAQSADGVIINADAMQVYRELRILTARPTEAQEQTIPHLLYGALPITEICSAARWLELVQPVIDETLANGKMPVITGGTGLYLKALMEGLSPIPNVPVEIRAHAEALWQEQGARALKERDAVMGAQLKDGDTQRHIRALSVLLATGKSLSFWQAVPRIKPYPDAVFDIEIINVSREALYQRCNARFLDMLAAGALGEAKAIHAMSLSHALPGMRAVGLRELILHLEGQLSLEDATKAAQQATRNYAKRQMTWFRNQLKST